MSTPLVARFKGRPSPCHKCGLVQGAKNQRCLNPDCAEPFRRPEHEHGTVAAITSRFARMRWKTRKDPPQEPGPSPAPERKTGVVDSVHVSSAARVGRLPRVAP